MKPIPFLFLVALIFISNALSAQEKKADHHSIALEIQFPLGDFSNTHRPGAVISYEPLRPHKKRIYFNYNAGVQLYPGKKEVVSGNYEFIYGTYVLLTALGGLEAELTRKLRFDLLTGPGLGNYFDVLRFTWIARSGLIYTIKKDWAISTHVYYQKYNNADALWTAGIGVAYRF